MLKPISCILLIASLSIFSCKKTTETSTPISEIKELPKIETNDIIQFTNTSATIGGNVTSQGFGQVTSRGVCWSTNQNPTIANNKKESGKGLGFFSIEIDSLIPMTKYYVRAYATNSVGTVYGIEKSFTTKGLYTIGNNHAGGLIFYIDSSGLHGLVCAEIDQSTMSKWGCEKTNIPGALSLEIGKGQSNTNAILNKCSENYTGADICNKLVLNSYDDWFLPSINELELIYTNLHLKGKGNFSPVIYWSSTQTSNDFKSAQIVHFNIGSTFSAGKASPLYVRAIRAF